MITFFERRHRGFRIAEKCLEEQCACFGKCKELVNSNKTWISPGKHNP